MRHRIYKRVRFTKPFHCSTEFVSLLPRLLTTGQIEKRGRKIRQLHNLTPLHGCNQADTVLTYRNTHDCFPEWDWGCGVLALSPESATSSRQTGAKLRLAKPACVVAAMCGAIFILFPQLDVTIAGQFYTSENQFIGKQIPAVGWIRQAFVVLFLVFRV